MKTHQRLLVTSLVFWLSAFLFDTCRGHSDETSVNGIVSLEYETQKIAGWTVKVNRVLLRSNKVATAKALGLLGKQLEEIVRVVPKTSVKKIQKVTLWFSPEYPGIRPRAEYHPSERWLRSNRRNPEMAKGVEFSNVRIFEAETRRMPNFALHELAHAFHDRELEGGFGNKKLVAAYKRAKASGSYHKVQRQDSNGRLRNDRAYALTNQQEYFAETSEAYFSRNDFFPFDGKELKQHDPACFRLLGELWGVDSPGK